MSKKIKLKKKKIKNVEIWTEEQYEEYMKGIHGMDFIAGFTENGVPFGLFDDESDKDDELIRQDISFDPSDELPF